jgi:enediyne polyketide synthase
MKEVLDGEEVSVAVEQDTAASERRLRTDSAVRRMLGRDAIVARRPDGKPEVSSRQHVSASHTRDLTLVVAGARRLACDVEAVEARVAGVWRDLLGAESFARAELVAQLSGETPDSAATRVWTAKECLKKAGASETAPLTLGPADGGAWVTFESPTYFVLTYSAELSGHEGSFIFAVLAERAPEREDDEPRRLLAATRRDAVRCEDASL